VQTDTKSNRAGVIAIKKQFGTKVALNTGMHKRSCNGRRARVTSAPASFTYIHTLNITGKEMSDTFTVVLPLDFS
jgi:hypothetical protein